MWTCRLLGFYRTLRYGLGHFVSTGHYILGHNFKYTGEVDGMYWVMQCTRCGIKAGIDEKPKHENTKL